MQNYGNSQLNVIRSICCITLVALESPMRTAMYGKSRVSSVISVESNCLQYLF